MANLNYIIEFSFSFCTKCCTYVWEHVNLNIEIHCHFTYCIAILHFTLQIEFCYTYARAYATELHYAGKCLYIVAAGLEKHCCSHVV